MEKEFNLSDKIHVEVYNRFDKSRFSRITYIYGEDIKEFIKRLKDALKHGIKGATHLSEPALIRNEWKIIDKLAGDKLI